MKKLILLVSFLFAAVYCFAQPIVNRAGNANTVADGRWQGTLNMFVPRYADTIAANIQRGIDSLGAIIFTYDVMGYWGRVNPGTGKKWERVGNSSGALNIYNGNGSLTGNRTLNGTGIYNLILNNLADFQVGDNVGTNRLQVSNVRTKLFSPLQARAVEVGDSIKLIGVETSASTGLFFPLINPFSGGITKIAATSVIGTNNTNLGSFYRWLVPSSQGIKGAAPGLYTLIDSTTNANSLTFGLDTTNAFPAVRATIPTSGASSLQAVVNIGNVSDSVVINASNTAYSEFGTVWTDAFARASFGANYGTTGAGATYTFPGSAYLNITGTANSHADYFYRLDSTNEDKGSITTTIVVNSKSASTFGVYIGFGGINGFGVNHPVFGGVTLTSGSNALFIVAETAPFTYTDPQTLTIANGDTVTLTLSRVGWTYTISYFNYTTDVSRSFTLTGNAAGSVLPFAPSGFSRPEFHTLGADIRVYNFSRVSNESKFARNVFIGNSIMAGGNITDISQRMAYTASGPNHSNVIINAGGGSVGSYYNALWSADLSRYAAGAAENFWCEVSGNDSAFSVWNAVGRPALIELRNRVVTAGKRFIWIQPFPRNALNLTRVADTVTAIATRYGDPLVPMFNRFNVATLLPADWNAGDGVHLTAVANRTAGYYIDSLFPQYTRQNKTTGVSKAYTANVQSLNFNSLQEWNFNLTAQTVTLPSDVNYVRINPSSTLAAMTIQLPYNVDSGHIYYINFGGQLTSGVVITALTLSAATGQTVTTVPLVEPVLGVTALPFAVGDIIVCRYLNNGRWESTPIRTGYYTDIFINGHRIGRGTLVTEQSNLAVGFAALNSATLSGTGLTAIGNVAGQLNTTGVRNTYVGSQAGQLNTTGSQNTLIGEEAGRQGTGANRTAVGYAALFTSTGTDNTGVGLNAMANVSTGTFNTSLGSGAGLGLTTGSNNLFLGDQLGTMAAAQANTIVIGTGGLRRVWGNGRGQLILGGSITNTGGAGIDTTSRAATVTANGTFRIESSPTVTTVDSLHSTDGGIVGTISAANWGRTASTGLTNTAGTWTANLSTGVSGGQSAIGGTAANDQLIVRGSTVASGSTVTNPDVTVVVGDGAGTTAFQLLKNTTTVHYGSIRLPIRTTTITITAAVTDYTILVDASGGAVVINLPTAASVFNSTTGGIFVVKKIDASGNTVTIDGSGSETIDGATTQVISAQWASHTVQSNGTAYFIH